MERLAANAAVHGSGRAPGLGGDPTCPRVSAAIPGARQRRLFNLSGGRGGARVTGYSAGPANRPATGSADEAGDRPAQGGDRPGEPGRGAPGSAAPAVAAV